MTQTLNASSQCDRWLLIQIWYSYIKYKYIKNIFMEKFRNAYSIEKSMDGISIFCDK